LPTLSDPEEPFNRAGVYDWTMERWRFGHV
jgi:hypothetical protein